MNAEFNRMRTDLANNFASAGAALLDYMTIDGTKTAALAAIPETDPQQYAIAGTLAGIAQMLPKAGAGVEATSAVTDGDSARAFVDAWHREHFPTDRTFSRYIMGRDRHCALAGDFAWQLAKALESLGTRLAATTQASTAQAEQDGAEMHDVVVDLRKYASDPGYSHNDYADTMRQAAHCIESLRAMFWHYSVTPDSATSSTDAQAAAEVRDAALVEAESAASDAYIDAQCAIERGEFGQPIRQTREAIENAIRALRAGDSGSGNDR